VEADLKPAHDSLAMALEESPLAPHAAELLSMAEPFIRLDVPPPQEGPLADFAERPSESTKPSDYMRAREEQNSWLQEHLPPGASRIGGTPDLPPGLDWPTEHGRKYMFLMQLDLATLPRWPAMPLPKDGWLYFFLYAPNMVGEEGEPFVPWKAKVLYHRGKAADLVRAAVPAAANVWMNPDDNGAFEWVPLSPRLCLTINRERVAEQLPDVDNYELHEVGESAFPRNLQDRDGSDWGYGGWLLGQTLDIDGTPSDMARANRRQANDGWVNLLAFHPTGSIDWGDMLVMYFVIHRAALEAGDFSDVRTGAGCA
jgi:hypothetical protein